MGSKPVFFDPSGRRASRVAGIFGAFLVLALFVGVAFFVSLFLVSPPDAVSLGPTKSHLHQRDNAKLVDPALLRPAARLAADVRTRQRNQRLAHHYRSIHQPPERNPTVFAPSDPNRPMSVAFYVNWDDSSFPSLKRALPQLDGVIPTWLQLEGPHMDLVDDVDLKALNYIHENKPGLPIIPLLQNAVDGNFDGAGLARLLANDKARAALIQKLVAFISLNNFQGIAIDFEDVPDGAHRNLQRFLKELSATFDPHGWAVILAAPFDDPEWHLADYAKLVDYVLLMAYDEHWETGKPGSIAGQSWFERTLDQRMRDLNPARTIIAIGNYGYDWRNGKDAETVTFQEAVLSARDSEADIEFDPDTNNPHFSYVEDDGSTHEVWFLDAVTAFNEIHAADVYRPAGYAVWRLGAEDPSLWSVMGRDYDAPAPDGLHDIAMGTDIDFEGMGEILHVAAAPTPGSRTFETDPSYGDVDDETYTRLPTSYVIQRFGFKPGKVALTFDDGPDPVWTPQILQILKEKHVRATFFIIGQNAEYYPGLVQQVLDDGHDIGSHTFTHPNLADTSPAVMALEMNATQRLFQAITGRSLRLFRPPYLGDAEPTTADELVPIQEAQDMGYVTVGLHIDPDDWQRPPAEEIISRTLAQLSDMNPDRRGQVVLLHDSGGDRSETVKALPQLIDLLRAKGYEFVPVSELVGLTPDQAMPPVLPGELASLADRPVFLTLSWTGHFLYALFMTAVWLGVARLVVLCSLALVNARMTSRRVPPELPADPPLISILIPAFNEAKVIATSINRLLKSDYPRLEIIVIDDGSTDGTAAVVTTVFANEPRVALISIPNGGKANAINTGLRNAKGPIVVALDADTQFQSNTVSRLVRWFADPRIGAVAGNAKVGNRINVLTRWQALEYVTAQNLERRALAALGCITVVPGAVGAWRREALSKLGDFPVDTLAEDQDLTIAVQKAGYKVIFDAEAIAWTEAPDTFRSLAKQRFRWAFGTLQCLWKHADAMFNPRYGTLGLVAMPQVWLFQIIFSVVSPLVDLLLVWQIIATYLDYLQHRAQFTPDNLEKTGVYYAAFILVDLTAGFIAFSLERTENWRLVAWLPFQRFGYRQLMYYVVVKSVIAALTGLVVGWGKQERKATVATMERPSPHPKAAE
jgi:cellulose synthase/poly-beta-1,6-N-acetylglucosamine synthase-like glycosyltransferase/peptidoglycan/xylan/chitin deacetylase (PgdA/CDA1 family)/spore germination protein YaaH